MPEKSGYIEPPQPEEAAPRRTKKPRWKDPVYIPIFLSVLTGFIVVAAFDLRDYSRTQCYRNRFGDPSTAFLDPRLLGLLSICILIATVLGIVYLCVAYFCTKQVVLFSMAMQVIVSLGSSIFYFTQYQWLSGVSNLVWLLLSVVVYCFVKTFIRSASAQIDVALRVSETNPLIIVVSVLGAVFCAAWSVLIGAIMLSGFGKVTAEECSMKHRLRTEGDALWLLAFLVLTSYLVTEVVKGAVRVTICYTYGWWCVMPKQQKTTQSSDIVYSDEFPSMPSVICSGMLAALTFPLGSVCLSSLLLTHLKLLTHLLAAWSQALIINSSVHNTQDISVILLAWMFSNVSSYLDSLFTHFTNYILIFIAVDNATYFQAFKRSFNLITNEGWDAVLNDCLAGGTVTFTSWCIGTMVYFAAYIYMRWINPYPIEGVFVVCAYVSIVSTQICSILTIGISCGVQTLFVAMAAEPSRIKQVHPIVYETLTKDYY